MRFLLLCSGICIQSTEKISGRFFFFVKDLTSLGFHTHIKSIRFKAYIMRLIQTFLIFKIDQLITAQ